MELTPPAASLSLGVDVPYGAGRKGFGGLVVTERPPTTEPLILGLPVLLLNLPIFLVCDLVFSFIFFLSTFFPPYSIPPFSLL